MYSSLIEKKQNKQAVSSLGTFIFINVDLSSVWIYQTTNLTGQMCLVEFTLSYYIIFGQVEHCK